jgi:hypothetical protein
MIYMLKRSVKQCLHLNNSKVTYFSVSFIPLSVAYVDRNFYILLTDVAYELRFLPILSFLSFIILKGKNILYMYNTHVRTSHKAVLP